MNVEEKVATHIRNMPPSGIRKFFDIVGEMKDGTMNLSRRKQIN